MNTPTIGVFPAAGGIGGSTVKHLLPRLPSKKLVFIARSPEKLRSLPVDQAVLRQADYDDDESLKVAFEGLNILFLISYASVEHEYRTEVRLNPPLCGSIQSETHADRDMLGG